MRPWAVRRADVRGVPATLRAAAVACAESVPLCRLEQHGCRAFFSAVPVFRALRSRSHVSIGVRFPASACVGPPYQSSATRAISASGVPVGTASRAPVCISARRRRSAFIVRFIMDLILFYGGFVCTVRTLFGLGQLPAVAL